MACFKMFSLNVLQCFYFKCEKTTQQEVKTTGNKIQAVYHQRVFNICQWVEDFIHINICCLLFVSLFLVMLLKASQFQHCNALMHVDIYQSNLLYTTQLFTAGGNCCCIPITSTCTLLEKVHIRLGLQGDSWPVFQYKTDDLTAQQRVYGSARHRRGKPELDMVEETSTFY